jgi:hypothetical protein
MSSGELPAHFLRGAQAAAAQLAEAAVVAVVLAESRAPVTAMVVGVDDVALETGSAMRCA